jgi:hypothetical protein
MSVNAVISSKELERQAALVYEGQTLKVMLCNAGLTGFTQESTVAQWQTVELSGNGYTRYSDEIGAGSYQGSEGAYLLPIIDAEFTASGVGYSYDRVILYIEGSTYPHSILIEDPNVVLLPGQVQTYRLALRQSP